MLRIRFWSAHRNNTVMHSDISTIKENTKEKFTAVSLEKYSTSLSVHRCFMQMSSITRRKYFSSFFFFFLKLRAVVWFYLPLSTCSVITSVITSETHYLSPIRGWLNLGHIAFRVILNKMYFKLYIIAHFL